MDLELDLDFLNSSIPLCKPFVSLSATSVESTLSAESLKSSLSSSSGSSFLDGVAFFLLGVASVSASPLDLVLSLAEAAEILSLASEFFRSASAGADARPYSLL